MKSLLKKNKEHISPFVFQKDDVVQVLPNKKIGVVTGISAGFIVLDDEKARPYMPIQLRLVRRFFNGFYPIEKGTKFVSGTQLYEVEFDNPVSIKLVTHLDHTVILISKDKDIKGNCTMYKYRELENNTTSDCGTSYYDNLMMQQIVEILYTGREAKKEITS